MTPKRLKRLRGDLGVTQAELARVIGVHPVTVARWEAGALEPNVFQQGLLAAFAQAVRAARAGSPTAAATVRHALARGALEALAVLLAIGVFSAWVEHVPCRPEQLRRRRRSGHETSSGKRLPGGKGRSVGQRMGRRGTP